MASTATEWPRRESKRERERVCILLKSSMTKDRELMMTYMYLNVGDWRYRLDPHPHPCGDQEPSQCCIHLHL